MDIDSWQFFFSFKVNRMERHKTWTTFNLWHLSLIGSTVDQLEVEPHGNESDSRAVSGIPQVRSGESITNFLSSVSSVCNIRLSIDCCLANKYQKSLSKTIKEMRGEAHTVACLASVSTSSAAFKRTKGKIKWNNPVTVKLSFNQQMEDVRTCVCVCVCGVSMSIVSKWMFNEKESVYCLSIQISRGQSRVGGCSSFHSSFHSIIL